MKIDIHTHILPRNIPHWKKKYGYGSFVSLESCDDSCAMMKVDGKDFRKIKPNTWDPLVRLEECDLRGVDVQVLSTIPILFSYWAKAPDAHDMSQFLNDHIATVVSQHPKRFIGLGTVPLQDPNLAIQEMERCIQELGFLGLQIGSHVNGKNLEDASFYKFYEAAEDLGAALFIHPWDMMGKERMSKYWLPWLVGMPAETSLAICSMVMGGIFERFPRLRVCFAHGGGAFAGTLGRIEHGFQVRPDLCAQDSKVSPLQSVSKFYVDSLVHDPKALQLLIDTFGSGNIALGSDYPFPLGEAHPGRLIEDLNLSVADRDNLLFGSAMRWLNCSIENFSR